MMNLKVVSSDGFIIVAVEGRIDTTNSTEFEKPVMEIIDQGGTSIIVDCTELNYISSSGLRAFLVIQKKLNNLKGQFRLFGLQPVIREIFDISGFSIIFSVFPDSASALKAESFQ